MREEVEVLENHSYVLTNMVDIGRFFSQIITIYCDMATRYLLEKVKATEESGFTRTVRAEYREVFTPANIKGEIIPEGTGAKR